MVEHQEEEIPPCLISIDKEGRWYHEGAEMIHRDFIRLFYQNLELDSQNRYIITWNGKRCQVGVEDTAFVVRRVTCAQKDSPEHTRFLLSLSDDTVEELAPQTLWIGEENVLYCRVKEGAFPARFTRPAYYQLCQHIEEEADLIYLFSKGKKYPLYPENPGS